MQQNILKQKNHCYIRSPLSQQGNILKVPVPKLIN